MVQLVLSELNKENVHEFEETRKVLLESYQQYESSFGLKEEFEEYIRKINISLYNEGIEKVFIAKLENKIVGTLQLFLNATDAYNIEGFDAELPFIRLLAVLPEARSKGVARKLIDATINYLKEKGYGEVYLHTSDIMESAVRLYERYGFERYTDFDFQKTDRLVKCYRFKF